MGFELDYYNAKLGMWRHEGNATTEAEGIAKFEEFARENPKTVAVLTEKGFDVETGPVERVIRSNPPLWVSPFPDWSARWSEDKQVLAHKSNRAVVEENAPSANCYSAAIYGKPWYSLRIDGEPVKQGGAYRQFKTLGEAVTYAEKRL